MTQEERLLVRVSFRKQLSDGNYGTEAAEITLEDFASEPDEQAAISEMLLEEARKHVHAELAKSPSARVRQAVADTVEKVIAAANGAEENPF